MNSPLFENGARFVRAALQVNPFSYLVKNSKAPRGMTEKKYNTGLVDELLKNDVSVIAVTDHYSIAESTSLIDAAEEEGIFAFPGFEAATSDGVHYLCIFERRTPVREIERCIGSCGVKKAEEEGSIGDIDSRKLLSLGQEWDAVVIAAHATDSKGLLGHLSGETRERAWRDERLTAIALSTPLSGLSNPHAEILKGNVTEYKRPYPVAVIYAPDIIAADDLKKPAGWTWLKLSTPSLDGLRHAFLDPDSRLRLPEAAEEDEHPRMLSIEWEGGFLNGQKVPLNPGLNVLVGPRGAGKSTVLESIRFVLDLEPLGSDAKIAHQGFVDEVLGAGTKVTLNVEDPQQQEEWIIERPVHGQPIVKMSDGMEADLRPDDVLGRVEFFGQHEVAELARMPEERSHLLDRFRPTTAKPKRTRSELADMLADNREAILEELETYEELMMRLERLPGIENQLTKYAKVGVRKRLELEARYEEEEPLLTEIEDLLDGCDQEAEGLEAFDVPFLDDEQIGELPSAADFRRLRSSLEKLSDFWTRTEEDLRSHTDQVRRLLDEVRSKRTEKRKTEQEKYLKRLRDLKAENIDGARYLELERLRAELQADERKRTAAQGRLKKLRDKRKALLKEWDDIQRREHQGLEMAAKKVSGQLSPTVRILCTLHGDRRPLVEFLRENTTGQLHNVVQAVAKAAPLGSSELAAACRSGEEAVGNVLDLTGKQVAKLSDLDEELLLEMEELWLPSTTSIELRVGEKPGGQPIWRGLEHLSTGEKATAILLVLLLSSNTSSPLVIDQAEDDLDNSFIADDIVPRLRAEKHRRQFILSTHNPNIPVLGDAEQVVRLTPEGEAASGGRGSIKKGHTGSLDSPSIRRVIEALEGGRAAFERRRRRYGY